MKRIKKGHQILFRKDLNIELTQHVLMPESFQVLDILPGTTAGTVKIVGLADRDKDGFKYVDVLFLPVPVHGKALEAGEDWSDVMGDRKWSHAGSFVGDHIEFIILIEDKNEFTAQVQTTVLPADPYRTAHAPAGV